MSLKSLAQASLRQSYPITRFYHGCKLRWEGHRSSDKILIYQMGKVGSTTIWHSLEQLGLKAPIYHIHTLNPEHIQQKLRKIRENFSQSRFIYLDVVQAAYLQNQLIHENFDHPWSVITLVRDPMRQILSSFFQQLEKELKLGNDYRPRVKTEGYDKVLDEIISRFKKEYVHNLNRQHPFTWFEHNLERHLNIDIFSFSPLAGTDFQIYEGSKVRVLLLKLESLNDCYQQAFKSFLGIDNFRLISANVGNQKRYKDLYKQFLNHIELPQSYIERIYDFKLLKHFYTDAEIQAFASQYRTLPNTCGV